jgi:hypothetical protein
MIKGAQTVAILTTFWLVMIAVDDDSVFALALAGGRQHHGRC